MGIALPSQELASEIVRLGNSTKVTLGKGAAWILKLHTNNISTAPACELHKAELALLQGRKKRGKTICQM